MTNRRQRIHSELAESRAYLLSVAQQIGPDQVLASSENPAWNVHDLLAHLAVAERGLQGIVQRFLAGEALTEGFSLDIWNQRQVAKQKERSVAELLASLALSRVEQPGPAGQPERRATGRARHPPGRLRNLRGRHLSRHGHARAGPRPGDRAGAGAAG
ncbi:MAG: maleylpyruvate isomerase N-terminal domain-containing protein [Anaerolineae bacterium]